MCSNSRFLILIFVIKILILFIVPVFIFYMYNRMEINKKIIIGEIALLILFVILKLFGNSCIMNSNISYIKNSLKDINYNDSMYNDSDSVQKIVTNKIYKNSVSKDVYYFNNNELPLSDKKIKCTDKEVYFKHYGNNITGISMLLSSTLGRNIDPIEILDIAKKNNLVDCDEGIDTNKLLDVIANDYHLKKRILLIGEVPSYVQTGGIVLAKVGNSYKGNNITCGISYIIIYNIDKENKFMILNPNDLKYDYICPSNTLGYGTVIKANTNDNSYSFDEIKDIGVEFITLER